MQAGRPISVLDPYEWLPPYGESGLNFRSQPGRVWVIEIAYDGPAGQSLKRNLRFTGVSGFHTSSFPGAALLNIEYAEKPSTDDFGTLLEFPDSEAAHAWSQYWQSSCPGVKWLVRHFRIWFLSENKSVVVFAEDFELSQPIEFAPEPTAVPPAV